MNKNLLAAGLSILLLLFTSSTALAHYCDDGYYVERQSREDCWWRVAADNPTQLDLVLDTGPTDLTLASPGPSDMKLLRVGDNGTLRGYSAPSIAGFGQLTPSTFTWQGTTHTITNLAVNPIHGGPGAWTVFMEVSPALTHNAERLTLQAGDRWFNFADARMDGGYVFWYGAMPDWTDGDIVPVRVRAYPASFAPRALDGYGNNRARQTLGTANSLLLRRAPVSRAYATTSHPAAADILPNPRHISNIVFDQPASVPNRYLATDMIWQWGQFLDHDITLVLEAEPREALPIPVPAGDPVFDPTGTGTGIIPFLRSAFDRTSATGPHNPRQQVNSITGFIDGSGIYGSHPRRSHALRAHDGLGKLKTSHQNRLLPLNTEGLVNLGGNQRPDLFVGGDIRVNEQVGLTAMHTLFVREHNRLADIVASENPTFTDQEIFEVARKINGAQIQVVTYREFLPLLLGPDFLGAYLGYDPAVVPVIANEFSAAAYRLGHSLLSPAILHVAANGAERLVALDEAFFNPAFVRTHGISGILLGLSRQQAQHLDIHVIDQVRNLRFADPPGSGGRDLPAINIQRGRDHGIPSYNQVRGAYGLSPARSFADVSTDPEVQAKLANAYGGNINHLELWPGGLAEDHLPGAMLGETFHAIVADQFRRLRDGDRYWYENDPYLLTHPALLKQVRSVTLADIIRRNTRLDNELSDNVFQLAGGTDPNAHRPSTPEDL